MTNDELLRTASLYNAETAIDQRRLTWGKNK